MKRRNPETVTGCSLDDSLGVSRVVQPSAPTRPQAFRAGGAWADRGLARAPGRRSARGGLGARCSLLRRRRFVYQLDQRHRRVVTPTTPDLDDARVAARAVLVARRKLD